MKAMWKFASSSFSNSSGVSRKPASCEEEGSCAASAAHSASSSSTGSAGAAPSFSSAWMRTPLFGTKGGTATARAALAK